MIDDPAQVDALTRADAVLFASPVYRASFSGVLKNFLDTGLFSSPFDLLCFEQGFVFCESNDVFVSYRYKR